MTGSRVRLASSACLSVMGLLLAGCALAVLGKAVGPLPRGAEYKLPPQPTLVFVQVHEDAAEVLGGPMLPVRIADRFGDHLRDEEVEVELVPQLRLYDLSAKHGDQFRQMPVHQIGRLAKAKTVILVVVEWARIRNENMVVEPRAKARVTVFEVDPYRRLFPADELNPLDPGAQPPGRLVESEIRRNLSRELTVTELQSLQLRLADEVARDASRLFYSHTPDE